MELRVTAKPEDETDGGELCRESGWDFLAEGVEVDDDIGSTLEVMPVSRDAKTQSQVVAAILLDVLTKVQTGQLCDEEARAELRARIGPMWARLLTP